MSNKLSGKVCIITVNDAETSVEAARAAGGTMVSLQPSDLSKPVDDPQARCLATATSEGAFGRR